MLSLALVLHVLKNKIRVFGPRLGRKNRFLTNISGKYIFTIIALSDSPPIMETSQAQNPPHKKTTKNIYAKFNHAQLEPLEIIQTPTTVSILSPVARCLPVNSTHFISSTAQVTHGVKLLDNST